MRYVNRDTRRKGPTLHGVNHTHAAELQDRCNPMISATNSATILVQISEGRRLFMDSHYRIRQTPPMEPLH